MDKSFRPFFALEKESFSKDLQQEILHDFNENYSSMMFSYEKGLEEVITWLLECKRMLEKDLGNTMIRSISSRLKSSSSICSKLERLGFPLSVASMRENLYDIAGIRVICSYIHDIYAIRDWLIHHSDFEVVILKDYIQHPKPTGYRSLHIIVKVSLENGEKVPCEIQLRTTAMDSWAALEHQLRYKKEKKVSREIAQELRDVASMLNETDLRMQAIQEKLSAPLEEVNEGSFRSVYVNKAAHDQN